MKNTILTIICTFFSLFLVAQGTGNYHELEVEVDGMVRQYLLYAPQGYDGTEAWPLVFLFHGYSAGVSLQIEISQMNEVADTAHFFIVYPEGLIVEDITFGGSDVGWNVPVVYGGTQNDIHFVERMIEEMDNNEDFNIDLNRVHATGYSNGGEFSYYLACALSDKIASVAPVASVMSLAMIDSICQPARPISVLHIAGTEDYFFPSDGDDIYTSHEGSPAYWAAYNGCDVDATLITEMEDINQEDQSTVSVYSYLNCTEDTEVLNYHIEGGGHSWPGGWLPDGALEFLGPINQDFDASAEIWNFFKRHPHPNISSVQEVLPDLELGVSPNPTRGDLNIVFFLERPTPIELRLRNTLGQEVAQKRIGTIPSGKHRLEWNIQNHLSNGGLFLLEIELDNHLIISQKILVHE